MSGGEVGFRGGSQFTWTVSDGKLFVPTSTSLQRGSTLTVSGGTVVSKPFSPTSTSRWTLRINRGDLALTGGTVDARLEIDAGTVTWSGSDLLAGREDVAFEGGLLSIVGSDFTLDGQAVTNFDTLGERTVTERGQTLAGILADGTAFAFELLAPSHLRTPGLRSAARLRLCPARLRAPPR
ncbi:MAG: hypothetical protein AAFX76_12310, partial [Planctomycetota bacterium]